MGRMTFPSLQLHWQCDRSSRECSEWRGGWRKAPGGGCFSALHTAFVSPSSPHPSHRSLRARCATLPALRWRSRGRDKKPRRFVPDSNLKQPRHAFSPRGTDAPELCQKISRPLKTEGAGNAGCPMHPQLGVRILVVSMHTSIHSGGTGKHPAFPTQWFYGFLRALPGDHRFVDPVIRATRWRLANLTPASGRQNHTASPSATASARRTLRCGHRIPPHVHDDRDTPLVEVGWRE